jgi:glycosyltransferase involved in cell wall biosynthesis
MKAPMPPPSIEELPPPPPGRVGWPWTEASPPLPQGAPDGTVWPRISIIVPSFNQGRYIEETLRSILLQGYPNLELHVIDGGSKDETVSILKRYDRWLTSWVSETDKGQSDAINKGFSRIDGQVFNWVCSDDVLTKGALAHVGAAFTDKDCGVFSGACFCQYDGEPERSSVRPPAGPEWESVPYVRGIWQPSTWWRPELVRRRDLVMRDLHYVMDRELWCHLVFTGAQWKWTDESLSVYRFTGENKSVVGRKNMILEISRVYSTYIKELVPLPMLLLSVWLPMVLASKPPSNVLLRLPARLFSKLLAAVAMVLYPAERVRGLQREFYAYSVW